MSLFKDKNKSNLLLDGTWGIERESPRVTPKGDLALTEHPKAFETSLKILISLRIFLKSQIEFITKPYKTVEETYRALQKLHIDAIQVLDNELLWSNEYATKTAEGRRHSHCKV